MSTEYISFAAVLVALCLAMRLDAMTAMGIMIALDMGGKRTVRTAMKQDVHAEENNWSWKRFFGFIALYTVAYIGMQVLADRYPDGNTVAGIVVGIIVAVATIVGYGLTWRRWH